MSLQCSVVVVPNSFVSSDSSDCSANDGLKLPTAVLCSCLCLNVEERAGHTG